MIDEASGQVSLAGGLSLAPGMSLAEVEAGLTRGAGKVERLSPRWVWCTLREQSIGGGTFTVALGFEDDRLRRIRLCEAASSSSGWDGWSEQAELERKQRHDLWLAAQLGAPPYAYAWGSICSDYDIRGGSSSIAFDYNAEDAESR